MNRTLKIILFSILGILTVLYLSFIFILPNVIDISQYIPMLQEIVKEQSNLNLEIKNPQFITSPFLEAGVKADGIKITLPDGSPVFETNNVKAKVFLPSALLLTVKVSCIEVNNPKITLDTNKQATQYLLVQELETMLDRMNKENNTKNETEQGWFNPEWIRIKVPNIILNNYNILVNDKQSNHSITLKGDELKAGYFNGQRAKLKTYAYLMSDDNQNVTVNIKLDTFLPKTEKEQLDPDDDKAQKIEIPFINIVKIYQKYDLKAHLNSKIKIRQNKKNVIKAYGSFDVDDFSLKLANYRLPKCYFHSKMHNTVADIDTSFYVTQNEKANITGKIDYNKPAIDLVLSGDKIYFNNLIIFSKAVLDSCGIRNDFNNLKGNGYIQANAKIKTNFKKLKSDGKIIIRDGALINNKIGLLITNTNADLIFDNNIFKIDNTVTHISGKPLKISGSIDEKTKADIKANTTDMPIVGLYNAFCPSDIKNDITLKSGNISLDLNINGKLKKALSSVKFGLSNLSVAKKDNSININNENLNFTAMYDLSENILKGKFLNKNLILTLPQSKSTISNPALNIDFDNLNIRLGQTNIKLNNNSLIKVHGKISDYQKAPLIDIKGDGLLYASDLRKFCTEDAFPYIDAKGKLPIKFKLTGNDKKQFFITQIASDASNYITPIHIRNIYGKQCITQLKINYKGDRLNIKDTGLYTTSIPFGDDYSENMRDAKPIIRTHGTLAKLDSIEPRINLFQFEIPKTLDGTIHALKRSRFSLNGNIISMGKIAKPFIHGEITASNIHIPNLLIRIGSAGINFNGYSMRLFADGMNLNGSDLNIETHSNFEFAPVTKLFKLNITSNNFDLDKVMKISDLAAKNLPSSHKTTASSAQSNQNLPLDVSGKFMFRNIKTGNIKLTNTEGNLSLANNILSINPMVTNCFKGTVRGKIDTNLLNETITFNLKGDNINVEQALADAANTKDALSGTASFSMDSSMQGSNYEKQMKSLKGTLNFKISNGSYGPIGKIENLILAENIRNSQFFQTALGGIIERITTIDTAHFSELSGVIKFKDGFATITPITSQGNVMCLHIAGKYDLLKNTADMKVRGRMGSFLSEMLGPIAMLNPVNLVKATPGINVVMAKTFSLFTVAITPQELKAIPNFARESVSDTAATKFQVVLMGDTAKPLSMIKSFKWLATQADIDKATAFTDNMPEEYLLADPTTPEAQAAAAAKAKEDAKLINRIKRKFNK